MKYFRHLLAMLLAMVLAFTAVPVTLSAEETVSGNDISNFSFYDSNNWDFRTKNLAEIGSDSLTIKNDSNGINGGAFVYAEAQNWKDYGFSAQISTNYVEVDGKKSYPLAGVRAYTQGTNWATQNSGAYEFLVQAKDEKTYNVSLRRVYSPAQMEKIVGHDVSWESGTGYGKDTVSYKATMQVLGGVITCYVNDVLVITYDTASEDEKYGGILTKGSVGLVVRPVKAGEYNTVFTNLALSEAESSLELYDSNNWAFRTLKLAEIGTDSLTIKNDSNGINGGAFVYEEAQSWKDYRFSAEIKTSYVEVEGSKLYPLAGVRTYTQGTTWATQNSGAYEFLVQAKAENTYNVSLRRLYGKATTEKLVTLDVNWKSGTGYGDKSVSYKVTMQVLDGVITCCVDDVPVIIYDTAKEPEKCGGKLTQGAIGLVVRPVKAVEYDTVFSNLTLSEAEQISVPIPELNNKEQLERTFENIEEQRLMVVYEDDFSSYTDTDNGDWEWEGTDTYGTATWVMDNGLMRNVTDNASVSSISFLDLDSRYEFGSVTTDIMFTSELSGSNLYAGPIAGYDIDTLNYYMMRLEDKADGNDYLNLLRLTANKITSLRQENLKEYGIVLERDKWYQVEMRLVDGVIYGYIDGTCCVEYDTAGDSVVYSFGQAGVRSAQGAAAFDNFAVRVPREEISIKEVDDKFTAVSGTPVSIYEEKSIGFGGAAVDVTFNDETASGAYAGPVVAYNNGNYYNLRLIDNAVGNADKLELYTVTAGTESLGVSVELDFEIEENTPYNVEIFQYNGKIYGYINNEMYLEYTPEAGILYVEGQTGVTKSADSVKTDNFVAYGASAEDPGVVVNDTVIDNPLVFTDNFEDEQVDESPDYWLENNMTEIWHVADLNGNKVYAMDTAGETAASWIHVFETNVDMSAKLYVPSAGTDAAAQAGLILRLTGTDADVRVVYDFATSKWYVRDDKGLDFDTQIIWADSTSEFAYDIWHNVRARVVDSLLQVWCDDTLVLETDEIKQITTGRVGFYTDKAILYADDVEVQLLSGQGRVENAVLENYQIDSGDATCEGGSLYWYSDDLMLMARHGKLWMSEDQGDSFRFATEDEYEKYAFFMNENYSQYIKLHNGYILKLDNFTGGKSYLSKDGGLTYEQNGKLWEQSEIEAEWGKWWYHLGMNDMLKEVNLGDIDGDGEDNYRVFYCADTQTRGVPGSPTTTDTSGKQVYIWDEVYYTDDYGETWNKSVIDTRWVSGLDFFSESRIMAGEDGVLRMYSTWNYTDSVRCLVSYDYGETWQDEMAVPLLQCSRSSFNYATDEDGTIYMCFLYVDPGNDTTAMKLLRNRFVLIRSTDGGVTWDFLMDLWRWDDVPTDMYVHINQVVDPSITITEDYIFVTSGWSEKISTNHNVQRQVVAKLDKSKLTAYEKWPVIYARPDEIVQIQVTAPDKLLYNVGEALDVTGGYLTVSYYDGSTKVVPLSDAGVEINEPNYNNYTADFPAPNMDETGFKVLKVVYEGFADNYTILVVDEAAEDGTAGDVTEYPVELEIDQSEVVDGAVINVENSVSTYTISGTLLSKGGNAVVKINGEAVTDSNITAITNTFYGQESAFSQEISLAEGNNTIELIATDATGTEAKISFSIIRAEGAGADSDSDSEAGSEPDSDSDSEAGSEPDSDSDSEAGSEPDSDTDISSDSDADNNSDDAESDEKLTIVATIDSAKTGDTTNILIWMFGVIVTAGAVVGLICFRKCRTR